MFVLIWLIFSEKKGTHQDQDVDDGRSIIFRQVLFGAESNPVREPSLLGGKNFPHSFIICLRNVCGRVSVVFLFVVQDEDISALLPSLPAARQAEVRLTAIFWHRNWVY